MCLLSLHDLDACSDRTSPSPRSLSVNCTPHDFWIGHPHQINISKLDNQNIIIRVATPDDVHYAETITNEMAESAQARGTGIAKRSPEYIAQKMNEGKAVIGVRPDAAERLIEVLRAHPLGREAAIVGTCIAERPGSIILDTGFGRRLLAEPEGEPLPRIC